MSTGVIGGCPPEGGDFPEGTHPAAVTRTPDANRTDSPFHVLRGLPEDFAHDLPVFIFTTPGLPFLAKLWHWPLKTVLAKKGYDVIGEFACRGFDTWGPLWLIGGLN